MGNKQRAVLTPLVYSDIFSYPLSLDEVHRFAGEKLSRSVCRKYLASLYPLVQEQHGLYHLKGRASLCLKRKREQSLRKTKLQTLPRLARILSLIPTVTFIGLSGSLAAGSARKRDDIDIFIICSKRTIFTTRLLLTILVSVIGKRRSRSMKVAENKLCLNMFLDESHMQFPQEQRDIYTAREIVQMIPLYERGTTYQRFMKTNAWVSDYFPNFVKERPLLVSENLTGYARSVVGMLEGLGVEKLTRMLQLWYMHHHRTTERIGMSLLAFHPHDHRQKTMAALASRMGKFEAKLGGEKKRIVSFPADIDKEKNIFYTA